MSAKAVMSTGEPAMAPARWGMKPTRPSTALRTSTASSGADSMVWTGKGVMAPTIGPGGSCLNSPGGKCAAPVDPYDAGVATPPVGQLLAHWRGVRRMSQLTLASEAQVSPRHVSFVESGRSRPSAAMVLTLARALDVPLRERNQMLLAAGHAPIYPQADLDAPGMGPGRAAARAPLPPHAPPRPLFGWLRGERVSRPINGVRLMFDPDGLRPHIANWDEVAGMLIQRVHREAVGGTADRDAHDLVD